MGELTRAARSGFGKLVWGIYPSYRLAKQTVWAALKSAVPPRWIATKSEIDLSITLKGYGSTIALRSADNPDALRGVGLDFAVLDEYSNIDPVTWSEVIRPALADKQGDALIMGSPRGYNALYDLYSQALETNDWAAFKFSTSEGRLVAPEEIEAVKATLDERTYGQEFLASFELSTNRVYLMFQREQNVRTDLKDTGGDLLCGIDFNVAPLSCVIGQKVGDELHIWDELSLFNSNTQELAAALTHKYPNRRLVAYPDPSGRSRKTSAAAGVTDFTILQSAGFRVVAPLAAPPVVDRVNEVNAMACNAQGSRRLFVSSRCKRLIEGLEQVAYREGTNLVDKRPGIEHHTDALGYLIHSEFPIRQKTGTAAIHGVW